MTTKHKRIQKGRRQKTLFSLQELNQQKTNERILQRIQTRKDQTMPKNVLGQEVTPTTDKSTKHLNRDQYFSLRLHVMNNKELFTSGNLSWEAITDHCKEALDLDVAVTSLRAIAKECGFKMRPRITQSRNDDGTTKRTDRIRVLSKIVKQLAIGKVSETDIRDLNSLIAGYTVLDSDTEGN